MIDMLDKYVDFVTGKDVIVVGPAACVIDDCEGIDVDGYDVVCRINWHWKSLGDNMGTRTDVIYHCMNIEQYTGSDVAEWKDRGIFLLSPYDVSDVTDERRRGATFCKRNEGIGLEFIDISGYCMDMNAKFNCFLNTGTLAIVHLLSLPAKSVSVAGFDFYETHYWDKHDENLRYSTRELNEVHNVKVQFNSFRDHVRGIEKFIPIGRLREIMSDCYG